MGMSNASAGAASGFAGGFMRGADWSQQRRETEQNMQAAEEQRREEAIQREANKAVSATMAAGPQETAIPMPVAPDSQAGMLEQQTAELVQEPAPVGTPDVAAMEQDLQRSTGRKVMMKKDWDGMRSKIAEATNGLSDPAAVASYLQYVDKYQQNGFANKTSVAATLMEAGSLEPAARLIEEAYGYIDDGTVARTIITKDSKGKPAIAVVMADEDTGRPLANPMVVNADTLRNMSEYTKNSTEWGKHIQNAQAKADQHRETLAQRERESQARLTATRERTNAITARANAKGAAKQTAAEQKAIQDRANDLIDAANEAVPLLYEQLPEESLLVQNLSPNQATVLVQGMVQAAAQEGIVVLSPEEALQAIDNLYSPNPRVKETLDGRFGGVAVGAGITPVPVGWLDSHFPEWREKAVGTTEGAGQPDAQQGGGIPMGPQPSRERQLSNAKPQQGIVGAVTGAMEGLGEAVQGMNTRKNVQALNAAINQGTIPSAVTARAVLNSPDATPEDKRLAQQALNMQGQPLPRSTRGAIPSNAAGGIQR